MRSCMSPAARKTLFAISSIILIAYTSADAWTQEVEDVDATPETETTPEAVPEPEVEDDDPYVFTTSDTHFEPLQLVLSPNELSPDPTLNLGEVVDQVPGIAAVVRSGSSVEPVIRGLGWERVQTQVGAVPIFGACPSRMDPPVTYLPAHPHGTTTLTLGLPSVTFGPGGPGGRIVLSGDIDRLPTERFEANGWVAGTYDSVREGWGVSLGEYGGAEWIDTALSAEISRLNGYESGDGSYVPSNADSFGGTLNLGFRTAENQRFWNELRYAHHSDVEYPTLPMDDINTNFWLYNGGYRIDPRNSALERVELTGGFSLVDHLMNNQNKPNRQMLEAETPSRTLSGATTLRFDLAPSEAIGLDTGVNFTYLNRDATRQRHMVASGQTFYDHIWPDATQWTLGAFGEVVVPFANTLGLRSGARIDMVDSTNGDPDGPSLGGQTIREQYVNYYGPEAADVDQIDIVGAINAQLHWTPSELWTIYGGGGGTMRAASVTERYFTFAPAPGGFLVGDPSLSPETKWEIVAGVELDTEWVDISLTGYTFFYTNYILTTVIDERDANGDGTPDSIYGFQNISAFLAGGELAATFTPIPHLTIPTAIAYTYGQNQTDDRPLPEIPALMGHADIRFDYGTKYAWWLSFGTFFAGKQTRIDPAYPETETTGYAILRASAGLFFWRQLEVELLANNLLNTEYTPHLNRNVVFPVGGLEAGQPLPAPGLSFVLTGRWTF